MRIKYKEPYWCKYKWDISSHRDNQYVTEFNKTENNTINEFMHGSDWIINCEFSFDFNYTTDTIFTLFGKPGKNMGVTLNRETNVLAFEFWTVGRNGNDVFNFMAFDGVSIDDMTNGVIISVCKFNNEYRLYKNFQLINSKIVKNELIDDYKVDGILFGVGNPGTHVESHRYYGEYDLNYFSIILNDCDIKKSEYLYKNGIIKVIDTPLYDNVLTLYEFDEINNLGIIYDNSKNCNFLEKIPKDFIKN
jgi:hypothetical protein